MDCTEPVMRTDEHFVTKHAMILALKNKKAETVFLGDSLTRRWEEHEDLWKRFFSPYTPENFGIGGDAIENILWRVMHGELDGMSPQVIVLLVGTNNLDVNTTEEIGEGIRNLVTVIRRRQPAAQLLLLGLLPRNPGSTGMTYTDRITAINKNLEEFAQSQDNESVHYSDLGSVLSTENGGLNPACSDDGLHLNAHGYERIGPPVASLIAGLFKRPVSKTTGHDCPTA
ncbi:GDSL-type esterase/lipase family protein [Parasphaerochaeta coccoides]|uniref:Lipolytic protein G-D-S-L family n=1 Tax=Parasphaerochaeta coccoides (strain ATCC BAA-1237 / DSM 17374 / SPN1) TaxID=760011 RepID=F4GLH5_PARC1|nr:GDSL-type esterase/lipase family protein [Parasphaerochaeta coccoides]AEC01945.1 lipolytic protein G-D-S-L family [Parasphaerochaeta coccoides DSM 17374]